MQRQRLTTLEAGLASSPTFGTRDSGGALETARAADARWRYDRRMYLERRVSRLRKRLTRWESRTRVLSGSLLVGAFVLVQVWLFFKNLRFEADVTAIVGWVAAAAVAALAVVPTGGMLGQVLLRWRLRRVRERGRRDGIEVES